MLVVVVLVVVVAVLLVVVVVVVVVAVVAVVVLVCVFVTQYFFKEYSPFSKLNLDSTGGYFITNTQSAGNERPPWSASDFAEMSFEVVCPNICFFILFTANYNI